MSAYNDLDFSKFIIKRDDSITDFFRKWDELLTSAKAERLLDYLTGKTHVKPEADVEALNKTRLSFFLTALVKQTKQDESNLTQQIWQQITDNELYAYLYAAPINAVNPNFPTQGDNNSRTRILYNSNAYLAYLYKENGLHSSVHLLPSPPSPSWYCSKTYRDSLMITDDPLFDIPVNCS
jgi:hypothetical protein